MNINKLIDNDLLRDYLTKKNVLYLYDSIVESKYIMGMPQNYDDEGSNPPSITNYVMTIDRIVRTAELAMKTSNKKIAIPVFDFTDDEYVSVIFKINSKILYFISNKDFPFVYTIDDKNLTEYYHINNVDPEVELCVLISEK